METSETSEKYTLIQETLSQKRNKLTVVHLCQVLGVARSGYYAWQGTKERRSLREEQDKEDFKLIQEAYNYRGYNKGSRGIHMYLLQNDIIMNRKKIQRLMRKAELYCPIRKANPYRRMAKAMQTDSIAPNLVNREFEKHGPGKILLTDITYIKTLCGRFSYLSTVKDAFTKQILAYRVSDSLSMDFVLETMKDLKQNHSDHLYPSCSIHSD